MLWIFLYTLFLGLFQQLKSYKRDTVNIGTVLFRDIDIARGCWSKEEIALLNSRYVMQDLIPENILDADTDDYVPALLDYFKMCVESVKEKSRGRARHLLLLALADVYAGYLHVFALPFTKERYYAGIVRYEYARKLHDLYEDLKTILLTNGDNWARPKKDLGKNLLIFPLYDTSIKTSHNSCNKLVTFSVNKPSVQKNNPACHRRYHNKHHRHNKIRQKTLCSVTCIIPMPFLDDPKKPSVIAVPFKESGMTVINLNAPRAAFIVYKFYEASISCLKSMDMPIETIKVMKKNFYRWIKKEVVPKLQDDDWYFAFGGVLKIIAALNGTMNKGEYALDEHYVSRHSSSDDEQKKGIQEMPVEYEKLSRQTISRTSLSSNVNSNSNNSNEESYLPKFMTGTFMFVSIVVLAVCIASRCCFEVFVCCRWYFKKKRQPQDPEKNIEPDSSSRLFNTVVQVMYSLRKSKIPAEKADDNAEHIPQLPPMVPDEETNCPMTSPRCKPRTMSSRLTSSSQDPVSNGANQITDYANTEISSSDGESAIPGRS